jgi:hypothetical protein
MNLIRFINLGTYLSPANLSTISHVLLYNVEHTRPNQSAFLYDGMAVTGCRMQAGRGVGTYQRNHK